MNLCECGCGQTTTKYRGKYRRFIHGHNGRGKKRPDFSEILRKRTGENHPLFGKHHNEETRKKQRKAMKGKYIGENNPMFGKNHTEEAKIKNREAKLGKNNPNWNPDRKQVYAPYTEKFYDKKFRKQILSEQKQICPVCNKKLKGRMEFHHIDSDKQNDERDNLVFLHPKCHGKTKGSSKNRNHWKRKLERKKYD